ncbi:MarR family transcriptional regulator [Sphingopyxis sp. NJF-3]
MEHVMRSVAMLADQERPVWQGASSPERPMSVLLVADGCDAAPEPAVAARLRVTGPVAPARAAGHVRDTISPDIVWLRGAERLDDAVLAELGEALAARGGRLMCETSLAALDRVAAAIPPSVRTEWLVEADSADRLMAVAALQSPRLMAVNDMARDDTMERIDRLQEEVARIARLLGDLTAPRGLPGTPKPYAAHGEAAGDYPGQLRSPPRDYAATPRSFLPEERTIDRQRAKGVRRMLRQRRMREQYFPADLFADPAWDMLLDLYAARLERQPVSVSSLCIAAAVPATTALRWIKTMTDAGLFLREADPDDGRRIFIALAEGAFDAMARYFEALEE